MPREEDMKVAVVVEQGEDGKFTAYCDDLRCVADGDTAEEALQNLLDCVHLLMAEYGPEVRERLKRKTYHLISV